MVSCLAVARGEVVDEDTKVFDGRLAILTLCLFETSRARDIKVQSRRQPLQASVVGQLFEIMNENLAFASSLVLNKFIEA